MALGGGTLQTHRHLIEAIALAGKGEGNPPNRWKIYELNSIQNQEEIAYCVTLLQSIHVKKILCDKIILLGGSLQNIYSFIKYIIFINEIYLHT